MGSLEVVSHSISKAEFATPYVPRVRLGEGPRRFSAVEPITPVTRNNFNAFFIRNNALSRGNIGLQIADLEWLRVNAGFGYIPTFTNFLEAGGWSCLADQEHEEFIAAFRRVQRHPNTTSDAALSHRFSERVNVLVSNLISPQFVNDVRQTYPDFEGMPLTVFKDLLTDIHGEGTAR